MTTTLVLKIESVSSSLTARYATLLALDALRNANLISSSYVSRYRNKSICRSTAISYIRKHAKFAIKAIATNKSTGAIRYEVYLRFELPQIETFEEMLKVSDEEVARNKANHVPGSDNDYAELMKDEPTSFPDTEPTPEPKFEDHPDADAINNYIGNDESINDQDNDAEQRANEYQDATHECPSCGSTLLEGQTCEECIRREIMEDM